MSLSLKDVVLNIKNAVFNNEDVDVESICENITNESELSSDDVRNFYNLICIHKINDQKPVMNHAKNKLWNKVEDDILMLYIETLNDLGETYVTEKGKIRKKSNKVAFEEIGEVLDRTADAVAFRYYEIRKNFDFSSVESGAENKNIDLFNMSDKTNEDDEPVDELVSEEIKTDENKKGGDLLDDVIELVDNIDKAEIEVGYLFKGLLAMSKKAVENSNVEKIEELQSSISFLEEELNKEQKKNESLQDEVSKLIKDFERMKSEIEYFDGLNGKQKLKQLSNFNRNIKYILDKFGGVVSVKYNDVV